MFKKFLIRVPSKLLKSYPIVNFKIFNKKCITIKVSKKAIYTYMNIYFIQVYNYMVLICS